MDTRVWYDLAEGVWFLGVFVPGVLLLDALADRWWVGTPVRSQRIRLALLWTGLMAVVGAFVRFVVVPCLLSL
ncbi:MAG: hypothetical protein AB1816_00655 [Bacillota bacterium]